jgi:serine/threonine protein kinase
MELVQGVPLTAYADQQRLTIEERLRVFAQVVEAVAHAHRHLVVHRDLKPTNILVDAEGRVKLLDFGIAKLLDEDGDSDDLTRTGTRPMTPGYAAPEQVLGEPITTATDIYALGAILYELLTGRRAHPAQGRTMAELGARGRGNRPPASRRDAVRRECRSRCRPGPGGGGGRTPHHAGGDATRIVRGAGTDPHARDGQGAVASLRVGRRAAR